MTAHFSPHAPAEKEQADPDQPEADQALALHRLAEDPDGADYVNGCFTAVAGTVYRFGSRPQHSVSCRLGQCLGPA